MSTSMKYVQQSESFRTHPRSKGLSNVLDDEYHLQCGHMPFHEALHQLELVREYVPQYM